jgi:outer membrane protein
MNIRFSAATLALPLVLAPGHFVHAADLLSVYKEAQLSDAVYAASKAQYIAAQELLPQGRAQLLPNVNFQAGTNWNSVETEYNNSFFSSGKRDYYDYNYGVTVTQPIYRPQNSLAYEQAKIQVRQAGTALGVAEQQLILRVSQAYFDVLLARYELRTIRSQKTAVAEQLEQAKRNFVVGIATITDSREAQARYDLVVAQELVADNALEVSQRTLEQIVGKPVGELAGLSLPIALSPPEPASMDAWVEQAYQSSLQVSLNQQAVELAAREVERNSAGHRPTLDAVGSLSQNYADSSPQGIGSDVQSLVVGVQLNIPIYQGGAISSRTRQAVADQERARQDLENARRTAALQTRQAYLGVTSGLAQVRALEQAVASTELQLESTKLGQEVGVRTAVDVLNAEQQLSIARRDLAQALYNTILSQLQLKAAVGKIAEADLADINRLLTENRQ